MVFEKQSQMIQLSNTSYLSVSFNKVLKSTTTCLYHLSPAFLGCCGTRRFFLIRSEVNEPCSCLLPWFRTGCLCIYNLSCGSKHIEYNLQIIIEWIRDLKHTKYCSFNPCFTLFENIGLQARVLYCFTIIWQSILVRGVIIYLSRW